MKSTSICYLFTFLVLLAVFVSNSALKETISSRKNGLKQDGYILREIEGSSSSGSGFNGETHKMKEIIEEESSSSGKTEHSGYYEGSTEVSTVTTENIVERRNKSDNELLNQTSSSKTGFGDRNTVEEKLKVFVEEETVNEKTTLEEKIATNPVTVGGSFTTPIAKTLSEAFAGNKEATPTVGYSVQSTTDVTTFESSTITKSPTTIAKNKPTSFLDILHKIRQELDELLKWKQEHERKLYQVAVDIGEAFKQGRSSTWDVELDKKRHSKIRRKKRSNKHEEEEGLSKEIQKKIEEFFPCRHPQTMVSIKSGESFFNIQECLQCQCDMGRINCEKDLEKCYPNACHLLNGEIVPNLAIHNDGCNNCLCHFGNLICTHLRCPEAGHHYTNYITNGVENADPENLFKTQESAQTPGRGPDVCLECDHLPGPYVCGKKQWKDFPSICHALFCGGNNNEDIDDSSCGKLDPCASSTCAKEERCVAYHQTPCLAGEKTTSHCQQYKCISRNLECSNQSTDSKVCGLDGKSYSNDCEMFSKGIQLAYKGPCKKSCNSEVCGIESRTFASRCHAQDMKSYVDYTGPCEYHFTSALIHENNGESFFQDERCDLVYDNGRCAPIKCDAAVVPPGACCPVCGAALVVSLNLKSLNSKTSSVRLDQIHEFVMNLQHGVSPEHCKISVDLTYSMDILIVLQPYKTNELAICTEMASEIVDKINFERENETGILKFIGSATIVKEKPLEIMEENKDSFT